MNDDTNFVDVSHNEIGEWSEMETVLPERLEKEFHLVHEEMYQAGDMVLDTDRKIEMVKKRTEIWESKLNRIMIFLGREEVEVEYNEENGSIDVIARSRTND